jgi:hypothetical protein
VNSVVETIYVSSAGCVGWGPIAYPTHSPTQVSAKHLPPPERTRGGALLGHPGERLSCDPNQGYGLALRHYIRRQ